MEDISTHVGGKTKGVLFDCLGKSQQACQPTQPPSATET